VRGGEVGGSGALGRRDRAGDDAAAEHARLALRRIIESAGLAGRHAVLACDQLNLDIAVNGSAQPRRLRRARRAHLHIDLAAVVQSLLERAGAEPIHLAQEDAAGAQRLARPDHDPAGVRVEANHIERRSGRDAEAAPLPDRKVDDAVMPAQHPPIEVDDLAGRGGSWPQPLDHVGIVPARHEADVLAVMLVGHRQSIMPGELAGLRLGAVAERKAQQSELGGRDREQEIALVALRLARAIERPPAVRQRARSDVMAGGQDLGAEVARGLQQIAKLDRLVALQARDWGLAGDVAVRKALDHRFLEAALIVEHVMRNADTRSDRAGVVNIATGAAGALAMGRGAMIVKLQRNADHVIAGVGQERRRDRGIDAAGHRDHDARIRRTALDVETVQHSNSFRPAMPLGRRSPDADTIGAEPCIRYVGDVRFLPAAAGKTCLPGPQNCAAPDEARSPNILNLHRL
jgi:hypothetical protein